MALAFFDALVALVVDAGVTAGVVAVVAAAMSRRSRLPMT